MNGETYAELGESAWTWIQRQIRDEDGPWLPITVGNERPEPPAARDSLYEGIGGLAPLLTEIALHRTPTDAERDLADRIAARLRAQAIIRTEPSLFDGLAGDVTALRMLTPGSEQDALTRLAARATPAGWLTTIEITPGSDAPITDVVCGTAGVVMAAVWAGGEPARTIAATGADALLGDADVTDGGLDWGMRRDRPARMPNYSHGTAGIAAALAVAGAALDRPDLVDAARRGAEHLLAVGSLTDNGFVVPHTIPPSTRDVEPVTYTWCHGPTGTSYLFAALAHAGVTQVGGLPVTDLRRRCLDAVLGSGVPQRLRPGFWDNDGRCCGTAGVGDALLDAAQADPAGGRFLAAARTMGDALVDRAVRAESGTYWRFIEHREDPPLLPPGTGWMQGAAGIAAFLLRLSRVLRDGPGAPVVDRPDQWWAVPAAVRAVVAG